MSRKRNIHIVPHQGGGWATKRAGSSRAGSLHETQREAQVAAKERAKRDGVEVVTHRPNGQIRDSDSYGNDPFPPRDRKH